MYRHACACPHAHAHTFTNTHTDTQKQAHTHARTRAHSRTHAPRSLSRRSIDSDGSLSLCPPAQKQTKRHKTTSSQPSPAGREYSRVRMVPQRHSGGDGPSGRVSECAAGYSRVLKGTMVLQGTHKYSKAPSGTMVLQGTHEYWQGRRWGFTLY